MGLEAEPALGGPGAPLAAPLALAVELFAPAPARDEGDEGGERLPLNAFFAPEVDLPAMSSRFTLGPSGRRSGAQPRPRKEAARRVAGRAAHVGMWLRVVRRRGLIG